MDMARLTAAHPEGLLISKVVPEYKEMFGKELVVSNIGFPKLLRALESIPDIVEVRYILQAPFKRTNCFTLKRF